MTISTTNSFTELKKRIFINASVGMVFSSWVIIGDLERWFLKHTKFFSTTGKSRIVGDSIQQNDHFFWEWHAWPEMNQTGRVQEIRENEIILFDFKSAGKVKVEFVEVEDCRTQIILTQYEIPSETKNMGLFYYGCSVRWSFWLVNLKAFLEHGISLDEKSVFSLKTSSMATIPSF